MSAVSVVTGLDVIREWDALEQTFLLVIDGNRVRALALAALWVGLAVTADGPAMGEAVAILVQDRLALACSDELATQPIPYTLTEKALGGRG
jgi:hypothetical protein